MIKIYEPYKTINSMQRVSKNLINSELTLGRKDYQELCKELSKLHSGLQVLPVFNGTCATHLTYKALKSKLPNLKNIVVPNNVYVAAWNSILFDNDKINLIPVDCSLDTWCIDTNKLNLLLKKMNPNETGVMIVHNIGGVVNVPKLQRLNPDFVFIEDNCEGFLGTYEGRPTGTAAIASSLSFYANKTITCAEGGALILNLKNNTDNIYRYHCQGQTEERYVHDMIAHNYRMTNIQASMLLSQIEIIDEIIDKKRKVYEFYKRELSSHFIFQENEAGTTHSRWMTAVRVLDLNYHKEINDNKLGFETRPIFYPMSKHKHLQSFARACDEINASILNKEAFMIPSHPGLSRKDLEKIVCTLNNMVSQ